MTLQEEIKKVLLDCGSSTDALVFDLAILVLEHEKAQMIADYEMYKSSLTEKG